MQKQTAAPQLTRDAHRASCCTDLGRSLSALGRQVNRTINVRSDFSDCCKTQSLRQEQNSPANENLADEGFEFC
jgi:hypothetical protein